MDLLIVLIAIAPILAKSWRSLFLLFVVSAALLYGLLWHPIVLDDDPHPTANVALAILISAQFTYPLLTVSLARSVGLFLEGYGFRRRQLIWMDCLGLVPVIPLMP